MADSTQDELSRYLNHKDTTTTHPEDQHDSDQDRPDDNDDEEDTTPHNAADEDSDFADETPAPRQPNRNTSQIPSQRVYANTGPKGVITDAQNYEAAKRAQRRQNSALAPPRVTTTTTTTQPRHGLRASSHSDSEEGDGLDDEDDEFTMQWRRQRMAELQSQFSGGGAATAAGQRTYGQLLRVDGDMYLDVVEKGPAETTVVVLLYDASEQSEEVEDEMRQLAYRYGQVRFIALREEIAELQYMRAPAVIAYRAGEVVGVIADVKAQDVKVQLQKQGILP